MKSCWNCRKENLPDETQKCPSCGATVAVIKSQKVAVPRAPHVRPEFAVRGRPKSGPGTNRHAAVLFGAVVILVAYAALQPAAPALAVAHWPTALEAENHQMWLRTVRPSVRDFGRVKILDAWAAHIGQQRYRSMFASDTMVTFSGRQAIYWTTPLAAEPPHFLAGNPLKPVETLRTNEAFLHWVEVEYGTAPRLHVQLDGTVFTID